MNALVKMARTYEPFRAYPVPPRWYRRKYRSSHVEVARGDWAVELGLISPRELDERKGLTRLYATAFLKYVEDNS